ncbi:MAG: hypothetical protein NZ874_08610, partial [Fimbriimonadales bacterium]|nr:hypothetical protein [Fimbriimonadales bacterium]
MDELRYLLRGIVRSWKARWRDSRQRRQIVLVLLGVAVGAVSFLLSKRYLPPRYQAVLTMFIYAALALWMVWAGVRVGVRVGRTWHALRQLRFLEGEEFILMYDVSLEAQREALYEAALRALRTTEQFLQTPLERLPRRVGIVSQEVWNTVVQRPVAWSGWANTSWDTVNVVYHGSIENAYHVLLHEWTHLITARWCEHSPALFMEGIATAAKYHDRPLEAHLHALYYLYYFPTCSLIQLLDNARFYDPEWWHGTYAWAGSFVTYLLEQFGLPRFRRFYCRLAEQPVDAAFQAE